MGPRRQTTTDSLLFVDPVTASIWGVLKDVTPVQNCEPRIWARHLLAANEPSLICEVRIPIVKVCNGPRI